MNESVDSLPLQPIEFESETKQSCADNFDADFENDSSKKEKILKTELKYSKNEKWKVKLHVNGGKKEPKPLSRKITLSYRIFLFFYFS